MGLVNRLSEEILSIYPIQYVKFLKLIWNIFRIFSEMVVNIFIERRELFPITNRIH